MIHKILFFLLVFLSDIQLWHIYKVAPISKIQRINRPGKIAQYILTQTSTPSTENALVNKTGIDWMYVPKEANLLPSLRANPYTLFRTCPTFKVFETLGLDYKILSFYTYLLYAANY